MMKNDSIICPLCGLPFPHNCASEIGKRARGKVSDKKKASSRINAEKARMASKARQVEKAALEPVQSKSEGI